jgi:hypothetical protein
MNRWRNRDIERQRDKEKPMDKEIEK